MTETTDTPAQELAGADFLSAIDARLRAPGPKRILSLDGGGVRGILTAGILEVLEARLKARIPDEVERESFRLCDYFDLIGGTSTGSIIATWLALGHTAEEVSALYRDLVPQVFKPKWWHGIPIVNQMALLFVPKFRAEDFKRVIRTKLSEVAEQNGQTLDDITLDTPLLRTGLAIYCKRADNGSPWILTNNPRAKFWDPDTEPWNRWWENEGGYRPHANAKYPLAEVVRASAAAPTYLSGVEIQIDEDTQGRFIDGAVSTNNNPALHLFLMTTLRAYDDRAADDARCAPFGFRWSSGPERLLLISLGTGFRKTKTEKKGWLNFLGRIKDAVLGRLEGVRAGAAVASVITDTVNNGVFALQALSSPRRPVHLNSEVGDMAGLLSPNKPLLTFRRIDAELTAGWLETHVSDAPPQSNWWWCRFRRRGKAWSRFDRKVAQLNHLDRRSTRNGNWLYYIGNTYAEKVIDGKDFPADFNIAGMEGGVRLEERQVDTASAERVEQIAHVVHEAVRAWKAATGQVPLPSWDEAEDWMRVSTIKAVAFRLANPSAPASAEHERWLSEKRASGWRFGVERDEAARTNPNMLAYEELSKHERAKDALIINVVDALTRGY